MVRLFFSSFLLMLFCGCFRAHCKLSSREKSANIVLSDTTRKIEQEFGLVNIGTAGQTSQGVKMLGLSFLSRKSLDVNRARKLIVLSVQMLTDEMNSKESLRAHLDHYPAGAEMVWMTISVPLHYQDVTARESLEIVIANCGTIEYKIKDPGAQRSRAILQESYEEAVAKLRVQERI